MNKLNEKLPPLRTQNLGKKAQENVGKIKKNMQMENKNWNNWKFQTHWNKLEWCYIYKHNQDWITFGTCYNTSICKNCI